MVARAENDPFRPLIVHNPSTPQEIIVSDQKNEIKSNFTIFKLTGRLKFLGITFNKTTESVAVWHLGNLSLNLLLNEHNVSIKGKLGNMKVGTLEEPLRHYYPHLLEINADEMVSFAFNTFSKDFDDISDYDAMFQLHMNSCCFVFLQKFIQGMRVYFNEMGAMQSLFMSTAYKAASAARRAASKRRMGYKLEFANPILIIPRNCTSFESLRADLGRISISNSFQIAEPDETLVELFTISMVKMNLFSGIFRDPSYDRSIVDDLDIKVVYDRPSVQNKFFFPRYSIATSQINVSFSEVQSYLLFAIVRENVCNTTYDDQFKTLLEQDGDNNANNSQVPAAHNEINRGEEEEKWITSEYNLVMGQLSLAFSRKSGVYPDGRPAGLARVVGYDFGMCFRMYNDDSMHGDFFMNSVVISDERCDTPNVFRDFLTPRVVEDLSLSSSSSSVGLEDKQVQLKYVRTPLGDQDILIQWNHPNAILIPDAWLETYRYIWPWREDLMATIQHWLQWKSRFNPPVALAQPNRITSLKITFAVSNSELYLIQDCSNSNSRSIVVNTTFNIIWVMKGEERSLGFNFQHLEGFKCNVMQKASTTLAILAPLNLSVDWEWNLSASVVDISIDPLDITFSYQDFKLSKAILDNWIPALRAPWPRRMKIKPVLIPTAMSRHQSAIFKKRKVSSSVLSSSGTAFDKKLIEPKPEIKIDDSESIHPKRNEPEVQKEEEIALPMQPMREQRLDLQTGGLKITFINDSLIADHHVPLAVISVTELNVFLQNWSSNLDLFSTMVMTANYYNNTREAWEPVIEGWKLDSKVKRQGQQLYEISLNWAVVEINLTKAFVETAIYTIETLSADYYDNTSTVRPIVYPHYISNETGVNLRFWMNNEEVCTLPPGVEKGLVVKRKTQKLRNQDYSNQTISILIEGDFKKIQNLPIDKVGSYLLYIGPESKSQFAVFEVTNRMGSKVLHVRSRTLVKNTTTSPIDIQIQCKDNAYYLMENIEPETTVSIPLMSSFEGIIRMRPTGMNYNWCNMDFYIGTKFESGERYAICNPTVNGGRIFMFCMKMEELEVNQLITLYAPVILENLLSCTMEYRIEDLSLKEKKIVLSGSIESGKEALIHQIDIRVPLGLSIKIPYFSWSKSEPINTKEISESIRLFDDKRRSLELGIQHIEYSNGMRRVSIFSDYWFVNNTGLRLLYKQVSFDSNIAAGQSIIEEEVCDSDGEPREWYKEEEMEERKKPLMFSFQPSFDLRGELLCVKIANSTWSKGISINSVGTLNNISITDSFYRNLDDLSRPNIRSFQLSAFTTAGPDKFWRTKIVTFSPKFMLINNMKEVIRYRQVGTHASHTLQPDETIPFHWTDKEAPKLLRFMFDSFEWEWSGAFSIDELSNFTVKMRRTDNKRAYFARVSIKADGATHVVIISPEISDFPDFRLDNLSSEIFIVHQEDSPNYDTLRAGERMPYTWDEITLLPQKLLISLDNGDVLRKVKLSKIKQYEPIRVISPRDNQVRMFSIKVDAQGPTKVLLIQDVNEDFQVSEDIESGFYDLQDSGFKVLLSIDHFTISVIDETPQELMFIAIEKIDFTYADVSADNLTMEFNVGKLQVDNQLYLTPFPVVLRGINLWGNNQIFFHLELSKSKKSQSIDYYENWQMFVQEIDLKIEEEFFLRVLNFINVIHKFLSKRKSVQVTEKSLFPKANVDLNAKMLFFERLGLQQIQVNLSFANITGIDKLSDSVISRWLRTGGALANIDSAPLLLHGLLMTNPFTTRQDLIQRIKKHYMTAGVRELHKVLGSADIIGSPLSLMNNLGTGIYDFFNMPYVGMKENENAVYGAATGFLKGSKSLLSNSFFGIFNTMTKITGTMGKGIAQLSRDKEYLRERELAAREKARHAAEGFAYGVRDLTTGVFKGIYGVFSDPIRGALDNGVIGFFTGAAKGCVGLVVKPIVGTLDLATRTSEGTRNTFLDWDDQINTRARRPRYFGPDKVLQTYSPDKALGQEYLYVIEEGRYRKEWYLFHIIVEQRVVLVSNLHVCYVRLAEKQEEWNVQVKDIMSLEMSNIERGVIITTRQAESSSLFDIPTSRRLIYVKQHQLEFVYTKLLRVLKDLKHPQIEHKEYD